MKSMELLDADNYDRVKKIIRDSPVNFWKAAMVGMINGPEAFAVGSKGFVDKNLGILAKGRNVTETAEGYHLREPTGSYLPHFEAEKGDIGPDNTYFLNIIE